jgi:hypothetical protein
MGARFSLRWVEEQVERSSEAWRLCAGDSMRLDAHYDFSEQRRREEAYDAELHSVESELENSSCAFRHRSETQDRIIASFARFSAAALNLESEAVNILTNDFLPVGRRLTQWTSRFDSTLTRPEMIQACRNAWTACGLQQLLGVRAELTASILGYSLLYPYSDNYLDSLHRSREEKLCFSERFQGRLRGQSISAASAHEFAVWTMVRLIEDEYPRAEYPQVYDCLLAIHRAQEDSLRQLKSGDPRGDAEILRISCAKGGTSVLADACLVRGWLEEQESRFSFDWGVLLQLGDDLQDVREDLRRGSVTLFTRAVVQGQSLDSLVTQLLNFTRRVADDIDRFPSGSAALKKLLRVSWNSLVRMAVVDSHEFFTAGFLSELERSSPFGFGFLRDRNKQLARRRGLYSKLFDVLIEERESDAGRTVLPDYRLKALRKSGLVAVAG